MRKRREAPPRMPEPLNRYLVETTGGALFAVAAESAQDAAGYVRRESLGTATMVTRFTAEGEMYIPPEGEADESQLAAR
jgi:hypothetical protein